MQYSSDLNGTFNSLVWKTIGSFLLGLSLWSSLLISASAEIDPVNLLGRYERDAPSTGSHQWNLTWHPTEPGKQRWTDDAGAFWSVTPDFANGVLVTEADYPYALTAPRIHLTSLAWRSRRCFAPTPALRLRPTTAGWTKSNQTAIDL